MNLTLKIANSYGNYDVRDRLPKNYSHIKGHRLQPLCRKLKIRFCEALIGFSESRFGFVNRLGELVIGLKYAFAGTFSDGYASFNVAPDDQCGVMDGRSIRGCTAT